MSQVSVTFAGVQIETCSFTLNRGITPSVAVVSTLPVPGPLEVEVGTLRFESESGAVEFEDMAAEVAFFRSINSGDGWRWSLHLTDRRWKWQFGEISGEYNIRLPDGSVDPTPRKTPGELATLLLERMGEVAFDVSRMPAGVFPYVNWKAENPARALASLCESVGCEVVLGLDNQVAIWPIGQGDSLPTAMLLHPIFALAVSAKPEKIIVVGGPTRYQSKLKLEPIGREVASGHHKLIDNLSYKPSTGWESESPRSLIGVTNSDARKVALETVWKWYQVTGQASGGLSVPGCDAEIDSAEQYFPLLPELVESSQSIEGVYRPNLPYVTGSPWPYTDAPGNASNKPYIGQFGIDYPGGIVKFAVPVFGLNTSGVISKPTLSLIAAHGVTDLDGEPVRLKRERELEGGSGELIIVRKELFESYVSSSGALIDNSAAAREEADAYLDVFEQRFEDAPQRIGSYAGFMPISPNGRIAQVRFDYSVRRAAFTKASEMFEFDLSEPSAVARRRAELVEQWKIER